MKPQDILVLLKIHFWPHGRWTIREIASSIHTAKSIVEEALQRMAKARLYDFNGHRVITKNLEEFLLHGFTYIFPEEIGKKEVNGIPTAWSAPPLKGKIVSDTGRIIVWPYKQEGIKGFSIKPLYPAVPEAVLSDHELYEMFCLLDALRCGKSRERQLASIEIKKRLENK